eukprot:GDKI01009796.1.p1 GENE.GDKI01009796.1~~GDKI01009796.1.p1  ORF type:complete len:1127 (-),score=366.82 GDKI01009796.1:798-4178(-)
MKRSLLALLLGAATASAQSFSIPEGICALDSTAPCCVAAAELKADGPGLPYSYDAASMPSKLAALKPKAFIDASGADFCTAKTGKVDTARDKIKAALKAAKTSPPQEDGCKELKAFDDLLKDYCHQENDKTCVSTLAASYDLIAPLDTHPAEGAKTVPTVADAELEKACTDACDAFNYALMRKAFPLAAMVSSVPTDQGAELDAAEGAHMFGHGLCAKAGDKYCWNTIRGDTDALFNNAITKAADTCADECSVVAMTMHADVAGQSMEALMPAMSAIMMMSMQLDNDMLQAALVDALGKAYDKAHIECAIDGCKFCSAVNVCAECNDGFTQTTNTCTKIDCADANCDICMDDKICSKCVDGYSTTGLTNSKCEKNKCSDTNCLSCDNTDACLTCVTDYEPDEDEVCQSVTPTCALDNCYECNAGDKTKCATCNEGYELNAATFLCEKIVCGENCDMCATKTTCATCSTGYEAVEGACKLICDDSMCDVCSDAATCTTCKTGYESTTTDINGVTTTSCTKIDCSGAHPNCDLCSNTDTCNTCQDGYEFAVDAQGAKATTCSAIACAANSNCALCTSEAADACIKCNDNYDLADGACTPVSSPRRLQEPVPMLTGAAPMTAWEEVVAAAAEKAPEFFGPVVEVYGKTFGNVLTAVEDIFDAMHKTVVATVIAARGCGTNDKGQVCASLLKDQNPFEADAAPAAGARLLAGTEDDMHSMMGMPFDFPELHENSTLAEVTVAVCDEVKSALDMYGCCADMMLRTQQVSVMIDAPKKNMFDMLAMQLGGMAMSMDSFAQSAEQFAQMNLPKEKLLELASQGLMHRIRRLSGQVSDSLRRSLEEVVDMTGTEGKEGEDMMYATGMEGPMGSGMEDTMEEDHSSDSRNSTDVVLKVMNAALDNPVGVCRIKTDAKCSGTKPVAVQKVTKNLDNVSCDKLKKDTALLDTLINSVGKNYATAMQLSQGDIAVKICNIGSVDLALASFKSGARRLAATESAPVEIAATVALNADGTVPEVDATEVDTLVTSVLTTVIEEQAEAIAAVAVDGTTVKVSSTPVVATVAKLSEMAGATPTAEEIAAAAVIDPVTGEVVDLTVTAEIEEEEEKDLETNSSALRIGATLAAAAAGAIMVVL